MAASLLSIVVSAVSCLLLILLAGQLGWVDRREGAEYRKPRMERIPLVGGAAIAMGVLFASIFGPSSGLSESFSVSQLPWMALVGAFLLGLVDDVAPGGLGARAKFSGQCFVAALFAFDPGVALEGAGLLESLGLALLCLVAMNAVNTYDHADGFAGGAAAVALLPGAPVLSSAVLGYLPFNTVFRQRARRADAGAPPTIGAPQAMLGDSGSHMLGVALAAIPGAQWFLLVPVLDLARVAVGRVRRGVPFWHGDRTHLGHRLEGLGFHPTTCAAISALVVAPPLAAVGLSTEYGMLGMTLLASATLYFSILVISDAVVEESPAPLDSPVSDVGRGPWGLRRLTEARDDDRGGTGTDPAGGGREVFVPRPEGSRQNPPPGAAPADPQVESASEGKAAGLADGNEGKSGGQLDEDGEERRVPEGGGAAGLDSAGPFAG